MHIHHFALKKLAELLRERLQDAVMVEAFTQNKDEIVFGLASPEDELYLRINCASPLSFVWPLDRYHKAKRNVLSLFTELNNLRVEGIRVPEGDRSLILDFEQNWSLVLKMYGLQSNVLLRKKEKVEFLFCSNFTDDINYREKEEPLPENWMATIGEEGLTKDVLRSVSPLLDKNFAEKVDWEVEKGISRKEAVLKTWTEAQDNRFFLRKKKDRIQFLLFKIGDDCVEVEGIQSALHVFLKSWFQFDSYNKQFVRYQRLLHKHLNKYQKQVDSYRRTIDQIETERSSEEIGSLLMANLHTLTQGAKEVELFDFYRETQIKIKLKPELTPVQNAERYYKKQKKRRSRQQHVARLADELEQEMYHFLEAQEVFETLASPEALALTQEGIEYSHNKAMQAFVKSFGELLQGGKPSQLGKKHPFLEFEKEGFTVLVGKNAKQNDELTFKYSNKNDTWLHARDVPGSHVIIRQKAGREIPPMVLEYAASLAAGYSKRKNDTLAPVIHCLRKQVRKPKGAVPGLVVVDRESVIMVEPFNPH